MKLRIVRVADSTGQLKNASVSDDRFRAIELATRDFASRLFTADSFKALMGRDMRSEDAAEALVFFVSQLTYEETQMQERYYVPMQYRDFVPVSYAAGPWADSVTYYVYDKVGNAQFTSSAGNDIDYGDVAFAQKTFTIHHFTSGYKYTQDELRKSVYLKRPLPELRQSVALEKADRLINETLLLGNTNKGLTGLYNNASVSHAVTPSTKKWDLSDATPATVAQVISDFNFGLHTTWVNSGFNVVANAVLMPPGAYDVLSTTPASPTIPTVTILDYLAEHNLYTQKMKRPLQIDAGYDLTTAGASSTGRAVFYDKNPNTVVGHVPMPLQFLPPQYDGPDVKILGEGKVSGVAVKRITNMYYMDGIV